MRVDVIIKVKSSPIIKPRVVIVRVVTVITNSESENG